VTGAPDFAVPIVGWRMWVIVEGPGGYRLESVFNTTLWTPRRELAASCVADDRRRWRFWRRESTPHEAPNFSCSCGIYALKNANAAAKFAATTELRGRPVVGRALGAVSLWGRVLECDRGWRAEFAYPIRIYLPAEEDLLTGDRLDEIAFSLTEYGVRVEIVQGCGDLDLMRSLARHSHV
jgi:hypothetical protein